MNRIRPTELESSFAQFLIERLEDAFDQDTKTEAGARAFGVKLGKAYNDELHGDLAVLATDGVHQRLLELIEDFDHCTDVLAGFNETERQD